MRKDFWVLILILLVALVACKDTETPSPPIQFSLFDLPDDDGTAIILSWTHFNSFPTREYEIWRGTDTTNLELVTKKILEATFGTPDIESRINIRDEDYYLLVSDDNEIPTAQLVQATPENIDSLSKTGQKVTHIENEIFPANFDNLKTRFVHGDYFQVIAPPEEADEPNYIKIPGKLSREKDDNYAIDESETILEIAVAKPQAEIEFLQQDKKIFRKTGENQEFLNKYGKKIVAFITDSIRYSMALVDMEYVDYEGLEHDQTYYYRLKRISSDNTRTGSKILEIKPVDNIPNPPEIDHCLCDTSINQVFIKWFTYDVDIQKFSLYQTTRDDTLCEAGTLLQEYHGSWNKASIDYDDNISDVYFYLTATDNGGNKNVSSLFMPGVFEMASLSLPPDLKLVEPPNDDKGNVLSVQWEPPQLYVNYTLTSTEPAKPEYERYDLSEDNWYLVQDQETFHYRLVNKKPGDVPENRLSKVLWIKEQVEPAIEEQTEKNLVISYVKAFNRSYIDRALQKIGFVRARLDEDKWEVDRNEIGQFKFSRIEPGMHKLTVELLRSSGKPFDNPESRVELDVDAVKTENYSTPLPPKYYEIYRFREDEEKNSAEKLDSLPPSSREFRDPLDSTQYAYNYFVRVNSSSRGFIDSPVLGPEKPGNELFNTNKLSIFLLMVTFIVIALYFFARARKGKKFFIRSIAGIEHVDEALGRATEMGRPVLYILGLSYISDIATLAGLTVLGRVAKKAAKYRTRVIVPCCDPIVMLVAQETVKSAAIEAGRPDSYRENDVFFISEDQFAYAAAVNGIMLREKTATNFYMGMFYAESLLLAETGTRLGAIQIAGTDAVTQIPFFITTCDYTLIGEELYAASAYLSDDPIQVGSLKAQDYGKALVIFLICIGIILMTFHLDWIYHLFTVVTQ
ncbi:hypothetical protein JXI42_05035 [bacterium]|nr:hypothetical protein [bacterium]